MGGVYDMKQVAKLAIWNHVAYSSFNTLRCMSETARRTVRVRDVMEQHYKEAIRGETSC